MQPRFPFGHGLSYTSFSYAAISILQPPPPLCGDVDVFDVCVSFNVTNTGTRDGADIPQLYITYPAAAEEPPRQLRFFSKAMPAVDCRARISFRRIRFSDPAQVMLRAGESTEVSMPLRLLPDLAIWSIDVGRAVPSSARHSS